jgi:transposase-like protein
VAETIIENKGHCKADEWRARIAEQERSGLSVKQFCSERGLTAWSFYDWRKRLRKSAAPVRFALVERGSVSQKSATSADVEIVFAGGEQLRIRSGVDGVTLRMVIEALRA